MTAIARRDRGQNPGTQAAGSPEGAIADGREQIVVEITLSGSPAQLAADYATICGVVVTCSSAVATWRKR